MYILYVKLFSIHPALKAQTGSKGTLSFTRHWMEWMVNDMPLPLYHRKETQ
jgi:hypothetical protein